MATKRKTPPRRAVVDENVTLVPESRREKFERLLTTRMNRALNSIRLIGNLSTANYEWHDRDLQIVQTAIADVTAQAIMRFAKNKRTKVEFTLPKSPKVEEPVG